MSKKNHGNHSNGRFCKDILIISMIAAFCGFVIGLIFAPQTGRNFRKNLIDKAKDVIDRGKFAVVEARVKAEELLEKSKEKVEEVTAKLTGKKEAE
ncbi:MAG: YtxH domain-containing protein [Actinobacteria bacterium]|nr:YtxH domain-containing protein [Actinomycetota bacterium]MCL5072894.1 YtxH domain-containing protein [Actinomycetota bacterium]